MFGRSNRKASGGWNEAAGLPVSRAPGGLWAAVRELTPAEGLALVCLASWANPRSGRAQASDRQVCGQTGVSRDVMKRLRRKLAAMGIPVTPGNNLSHDSCCYDLGAIVDAETRERLSGDTPAESSAVSSLGAESTEGASPPVQGAKGAQPRTREDDPYAYIGLSREPRATNLGFREPVPQAAEGTNPGFRGAVPQGAAGGIPGEATGAIPQGELTSCQPTAPIWTGGPSIAIHLPGHERSGLDVAWKREVEDWRAHGRAEPAPPPPLPPYEQWLARR